MATEDLDGERSLLERTKVARQSPAANVFEELLAASGPVKRRAGEDSGACTASRSGTWEPPESSSGNVVATLFI